MKCLLVSLFASNKNVQRLIFRFSLRQRHFTSVKLVSFYSYIIETIFLYYRSLSLINTIILPLVEHCIYECMKSSANKVETD